MIAAPDPAMPKDGIKGTVVIKCIVDKEGWVREPMVIQSLSPENDESALESALKWRCVPTELGGKKVEIRTTLVMVFREKAK
jgi:TonB family protein